MLLKKPKGHSQNGENLFSMPVYTPTHLSQFVRFMHDEHTKGHSMY